MTGIRQLRRTRPLETEVVSDLRVPTLAELARIKAWLPEIDLRSYKGLVAPWNDWGPLPRDDGLA